MYSSRLPLFVQRINCTLSWVCLLIVNNLKQMLISISTINNTVKKLVIVFSNTYRDILLWMCTFRRYVAFVGTYIFSVFVVYFHANKAKSIFYKRLKSTQKAFSTAAFVYFTHKWYKFYICIYLLLIYRSWNYYEWKNCGNIWKIHFSMYKCIQYWLEN